MMPSILLVEDNLVDAELITEAFGDACDCTPTIQTVSDGEVALQFLRDMDQKPGFMLLDLNLPKKGGLEILKELDLYLTPNEGLALQEAAREVFRTKLHNLGVQFALAVAGKDWAKAIGTGRGIMDEFPNSKMAEEIRDRWDALEQKLTQQNG